jgi:predicted nucleic acid-binding protein
MVLVDATAWSLALRRRRTQLSDAEARVAAAVNRLVRDGDAAIIGPIRQEVLSGVRRPPGAFELLRDRLSDFPDIPLVTLDFERAAQMFNECAANEIAGSHYALLLCAVAERVQMDVLSTDRDFERYASTVGIRLYPV